jgi:hypothetical protein
MIGKKEKSRSSIPLGTERKPVRAANVCQQNAYQLYFSFANCRRHINTLRSPHIVTFFTRLFHIHRHFQARDKKNNIFSQNLFVSFSQSRARLMTRNDKICVVVCL